MIIKQLFEYNKIKLNDDVYKKSLQKFLKNNNQLSNIFVFTSDGIKATNYVGVLKYKNYQFEILPKLLNSITVTKKQQENILKNLLYMLFLTKKLDIKETDISKLCKCKNPFLEILIKIYTQSLFECLKRYIPKNYIVEEENLNFLKGKLIFSKNILKNSVNKAKCYCQYDNFSENNLLNQLFFYVSHLLYSISTDNDNKKILKFVTDFFCDIDLKKINHTKVKNLKLTKNQIVFTKPFSLAKMFLENSSIDFNQNKINSIALLWDMNKLFEEFIFEFIRKNKAAINNKIKDITAQKEKKLLIYENGDTKKLIGNTYIDMFLEFNNNKIILDTKYKNNNGDIGNFSNADIFQMLAYETLHKTSEAILLYPTVEEQSIGINRYKFNGTDSNYITTATIYLGTETKYLKNNLITRLSNIFNLYNAE